MNDNFDMKIYFYNENKWVEFYKSESCKLSIESIISKKCFRWGLLYKYIFHPNELVNKYINKDMLIEHIDLYEKMLQYVEYCKNDYFIQHIKSKLELLKNYLYIINCQEINNNLYYNKHIFTFEQLYNICEFYRKHVDKKKEEIDYFFIEMVYLFKMRVELYNTQFIFIFFDNFFY